MAIVAPVYWTMPETANSASGEAPATKREVVVLRNPRSGART
jgi:hypothetical protein